MTTVQSTIQSDPYYLNQRMKELQPYLELFSKQLAHIFSIMPAPKRILDLKTGQLTVENDPQWQKLIDKITNDQQEYLKSAFPYFYNKQP